MRRRRFVATVGLASAALAGCSALPGEEETDWTTPTSGLEGGRATVKMVSGNGGTYFDPVGLYVKPGDTVEFVNDETNHSATAYHPNNMYAETTRIPEGAELWDSTVITEKGETYERTFKATGTHDYYCIPHKMMGMVGRIVVGKPGGPAEGSMPPDGDVPTSEAILETGAVSYDEFTS